MSQVELYMDQVGQGQVLLCLHGWGMHGGVFAPLADSLADHFQVCRVDLPGHGYTQIIPEFNNLEILAGHVLASIRNITSDKVNILAWSMGGLIGQYLAVHNPDVINKLVLVSSTPCFENNSHWSHGLDSNVLDGFADNLSDDYRATLERFLALQFMGSINQKNQLRRAREMLFSRPEPDVVTLQQGLGLLKQTTLLSLLDKITCPTLVVGGEHDRLVSSMAIRTLAEQVKSGQAIIFKDSGHAPFLSSATLFSKYVTQFLHE